MSRCILVKVLPATETLAGKYVATYELKKDFILSHHSDLLDFAEGAEEIPVQVARLAIAEWDLGKLLERNSLQASALPPRMNNYGKIFDSVVTFVPFISPSEIKSKVDLSQETRRYTKALITAVNEEYLTPEVVYRVMLNHFSEQDIKELVTMNPDEISDDLMLCDEARTFIE